MARIFALIDTCVWRPLLLQCFTNTVLYPPEFKQKFDSLKITNILIHDTIHEELGNQLINRIGCSNAKVLLDRFKRYPKYQFLDTIREDRFDSEILAYNFEQPRKTNKQTGDEYNNFPGIGIADAKLILAASRFAQNADYDSFYVLTSDFSLYKAMKNIKVKLNREAVLMPKVFSEPEKMELVI
jgi:hypothetical protein